MLTIVDDKEDIHKVLDYYNAVRINIQQIKEMRIHDENKTSDENKEVAGGKRKHAEEQQRPKRAKKLKQSSDFEYENSQTQKQQQVKQVLVEKNKATKNKTSSEVDLLEKIKKDRAVKVSRYYNIFFAFVVLIINVCNLTREKGSAVPILIPLPTSKMPVYEEVRLFEPTQTCNVNVP